MSIPLYNHEEQAINAALKMISVVKQVSENLNLRVGIASGPLIGNLIYISRKKIISNLLFIIFQLELLEQRNG